jgi:hypothetical protein
VRRNIAGAAIFTQVKGNLKTRNSKRNGPKVAPNVLYKKGDVFMEDDVVAYFNYLRKVHTVSVNSSFQCCDSQ